MQTRKYKITGLKFFGISIVPILLLINSSFYSSVLCQPNVDAHRTNSFRSKMQFRTVSETPRESRSNNANRYITYGTIVQDSVARTFALFVPPNVATQNKRVSLVLVLHGGGGNAQNAMRMSGFNEKALKEGIIVAYPDGSGKLKDNLLTWNAGHCCGFAMHNKIDDVGFISKLIDKLVSEYTVDPKRVYVTGMSNGAMMTHRVGIELSDKIAAISPIVGTLFGDEKQPVHPVAAIIFNGMLDKNVPYAGGTHKGKFANSWDDVPPLPVESQASFWARANDCKSAPVILENKTFKRIRYVCPAGKNVELYLLKDQGHAWPGGQRGSSKGNMPSQSLNATDVMWEFFKQQSK